MIPSAALKPFLPYIAIGVLALLFGSHWYAYESGVGAERDRWQIVQAKEAVDRAAQEHKNRVESERRFAAMQEITDEAIAEKDKARADADAAAAAGARLRAKIRDLTLSIARHDPASAGNGAATGTAADLLDGLFGRLEEAENGIARYADEASAAGRACERSYDALTAPK